MYRPGAASPPLSPARSWRPPAHGIALDRGAIDRKIDFALTYHRSHKASMLQDLLAGRATEIEAINGAVVRAARPAGVQRACHGDIGRSCSAH
jgi:ketopantoate reductase